MILVIQKTSSAWQLTLKFNWRLTNDIYPTFKFMNDKVNVHC